MTGQLAKARDVRSLTSVIKALETKLGPFEPAKEETVETNLADEPEKTESQAQSGH